MGKKEELINIFNDTLSFIEENKILKESVNKSKENTVFYRNCSKNIETTDKKVFFNNVFVTKDKTFEAAIKLRKEYPNTKIAVLNFASATNPGGGVTKGSSAQEESLCRCSTLYPCLNSRRLYEIFYNPHRATGDPLHNDDIIYTPDVIICKSDDGKYTRLNEKDFVTVDVITCAAPNLRHNPNNPFNDYGKEVKDITISDTDLYQLHLNRAEHILRTAQIQGAKILVLGAFGCGAFKNNPKIVAKAYKEALKNYVNIFDEIEFAIYCRDYETENYDAFAEIFN